MPPSTRLPGASLVAGILAVVGSAPAPAAAAAAALAAPPLRPPPARGHGGAGRGGGTAALDVAFLESHAGFGAFRRSLRRRHGDEKDRAEEQGEAPAVACVVVDGAWSRYGARRLRGDARALRAAGAGAAGAGVESRAAGIRTGVHQVWLRSPAAADGERGGRGRASSPFAPTLYAGDMDARRELFRAVDWVRESLQTDGVSPALPPHLVELSYLLYGGDGASYAKHVDCKAEDLRALQDEGGSSERKMPGTDHRRAVSFLLYLGNDDDDDVEEEERADAEPLDDGDEGGVVRAKGSRGGSAWDPSRHGGALRIHGAGPASAVRDAAHAASLPRGVRGRDDEEEDDGYWADVAPLPGRMVLFSSPAVWHEVGPTLAPRYCVVGWFRTPAGAR